MPAFSTLIAEMLFNSTSHNVVIWESSAGFDLPSEWSKVETTVVVPFPSTAELIFRGELPEAASMSLRSITVKDLGREHRIGSLNFVKSTGGSIVIRVTTATVVPDPLFYRVKMSKRSTNTTATVVYAGASPLGILAI